MRFSTDRFLLGLKVAFVPASAYQAIGQLITVLSLLALLKHVAAVGYVSAFALMIDVYGNLLRHTVGYLDPAVRSIIAAVEHLIPVRIPFREGWRYIFVVLQLLFVRDAGTALFDGRQLLAATRLLIGSTISFVCSILIFLSYSSTNDFLKNAIFCGMPVMGIFIYDIVMYALSATLFFDEIGIGEVDRPMSRSQFFAHGPRRSLLRFCVVYIPSLATLFFPFLKPLPFPGKAVIAILVGMAANASYWLIYGFAYAFKHRPVGTAAFDAFRASEAGRFGLAVLGVLAWLLVSLAVNAGARLLNL